VIVDKWLKNGSFNCRLKYGEGKEVQKMDLNKIGKCKMFSKWDLVNMVMNCTFRFHKRWTISQLAD
jgi:hypothetical protein